MKNSNFNRVPLRLVLWVIGVMLCSSHVFAGQDMARHFKGKTINIIVGSSPGGGYDVISRLFARHVSKHLPGEPRRLIVRNIPGASGLKGTQYLFRSKPDGLTLGPHYTSLVMAELAGLDVPGFDVNKLIILGAPTFVKDDFLMCADRNVAGSWEELLKSGRKYRMGAQRPGGGRTPMGAEFVEMIGGPIKMIYGYKGTGEILAAFARGESQVTTCLERRLNRLFPELVKNRRLVPLFWWNARPRDKWLKQLGGPAPHNILELPNLEPTETQRLAFVTATKIHQFLRAFMLPPGTPGPLVNAWRKAFKVTIEDPEFIKAADIAGYDVGYGSPEEYRRQFDTIRGLSPEGVKNFQYLVGQR